MRGDQIASWASWRLCPLCKIEYFCLAHRMRLRARGVVLGNSVRLYPICHHRSHCDRGVGATVARLLPELSKRTFLSACRPAHTERLCVRFRGPGFLDRV